MKHTFYVFGGLTLSGLTFLFGLGLISIQSVMALFSQTITPTYQILGKSSWYSVPDTTITGMVMIAAAIIFFVITAVSSKDIETFDESRKKHRVFYDD